MAEDPVLQGPEGVLDGASSDAHRVRCARWYLRWSTSSSKWRVMKRRGARVHLGLERADATDGGIAAISHGSIAPVLLFSGQCLPGWTGVRAGRSVVSKQASIQQGSIARVVDRAIGWDMDHDPLFLAGAGLFAIRVPGISHDLQRSCVIR